MHKPFPLQGKIHEKVFAFVGGIFAVLVGVVGWFIATAEMPTLQVKRLDIQLPSPDQARLLVEAEISNTLKIPVNYFRVDYQIAVKGVLLVRGELKLQGRVAAKDKAILQLPLTVDLAKLRKLKSEMAGGEIPLTVSGQLHMDIKIKKFAIPFSVEKHLRRQKRDIKSRIVRCDLLLGDQRQLTVDLVVAIDNPFPQPLLSAHSKYRILLSGEPVISGFLVCTEQILPKQQGILRMPIVVDLAKLSQTRQQSTGGMLRIEGTVSAKLEQRQIEIPFNIEKPMPIRQRKIDCQIKGIAIAEKDGIMLVKASLLLIGELPKKLQLGKADYQASIDDQPIARAR